MFLSMRRSLPQLFIFWVMLSRQRLILVGSSSLLQRWLSESNRCVSSYILLKSNWWKYQRVIPIFWKASNLGWWMNFVQVVNNLFSVVMVGVLSISVDEESVRLGETKKVGANRVKSYCGSFTIRRRVRTLYCLTWCDGNGDTLRPRSTSLVEWNLLVSVLAVRWLSLYFQKSIIGAEGGWHDQKLFFVDIWGKVLMRLLSNTDLPGLRAP